MGFVSYVVYPTAVRRTTGTDCGVLQSRVLLGAYSAVRVIWPSRLQTHAANNCTTTARLASLGHGMRQ